MPGALGPTWNDSGEPTLLSNIVYGLIFQVTRFNPKLIHLAQLPICKEIKVCSTQKMILSTQLISQITMAAVAQRATTKLEKQISPTTMVAQ